MHAAAGDHRTGKCDRQRVARGHDDIFPDCGRKLNDKLGTIDRFGPCRRAPASNPLFHFDELERDKLLRARFERHLQMPADVLRRRLPYGRWVERNGATWLFNRRYAPIWCKRPGSGLRNCLPQRLGALG